MSYNGNLNTAITSLAEKARKAYFRIKKCVGLNNPSSLLEKHFDSLVVPMLLYCSEIWGSNVLLKERSYEKLHLKFIKEILGVHCKTSNDACRAELARLPLKSKIMFSCIKFLNHIKSQKDNLVYKVFVASKASNPWINNTSSTLQKIGYQFLTNDTIPLKSFLLSIKQRVSDYCIQEQNAAISNSSKLSFFRTFYTMNNRAGYVDQLNNRCDRAALAKSD